MASIDALDKLVNKLTDHLISLDEVELTKLGLIELEYLYVMSCWHMKAEGKYTAVVEYIEKIKNLIEAE
jgi:hypothetical protein